uniref:Uncharacterized protein n=1 Tax=Acrobeloides nanus TaxID=290746 RepID=A0A914DN66_9BILA
MPKLPSYKDAVRNSIVILSPAPPPYNDVGSLEESIDLSRFDYYKNFTREQSENALWQTIAEIAQNVSSSSHRRRKRFFLNNPVQVEEAMKTGNVEVGMPIILAPFAFSPIFGFIILGPIILSPYIFSPTLINPSLASPIILSPALAVPDFISPYIFGPFILSPFVMFPSFLSPY